MCEDWTNKTRGFCFAQHTRRVTHKILGDERIKKIFTKRKGKDLLSFEKWILCNAQQVCDGDRSIFVAAQQLSSVQKINIMGTSHRIVHGDM